MLIVNSDTQSAKELVEVFLQHVSDLTEKDHTKFKAELEDRLKFATPDVRLQVLREWHEKLKKWWFGYKAKFFYSGVGTTLYSWWIDEMRDWKAGLKPDFSFFGEASNVAHYQTVKRNIDYLEQLLLEELSADQPKENRRKSTSDPLTFEALFIDDEGEKLALEIAQELKIPELVEDGEHNKKLQYKAVFAALWLYLKDKRPSIVDENIQGQEACRAIATRFGTTVGKNFWSSGASERIKAQKYYRQIVTIMRKRGN